MLGRRAKVESRMDLKLSEQLHGWDYHLERWGWLGRIVGRDNNEKVPPQYELHDVG